MIRIKKWVKVPSPEVSARKVARKALKDRLLTVERLLPLAARQYRDDVEYVHQLRVATRRAMAALRLFEDWIPEREDRWVAKRLKRIRKAAGEARELDVLTRQLEDRTDEPLPACVLETVRVRRRQAQKPIVAIDRKIGSSGRLRQRTQKLLRRTKKRCRQSQDAAQPFAQWARRRFQPVLEEFFEAGLADLTDTDALHRFRIRGKELRYAMELLGGAFPDEFRDQLYPQVEVLQEKLGAVNDHATAEARFARWIDRCEDPLQREFLEELRAEELRRLDDARAAFFDWWSPDQLLEFRAEFDRLLPKTDGQPTQLKIEGSAR